MKAVVSVATRMPWVHLSVHVHPSGTSGTNVFAQIPSNPGDYDTAFPGAINAVIGARNNQATFYSQVRGRDVASIPLSAIRRR